MCGGLSRVIPENSALLFFPPDRHDLHPMERMWRMVFVQRILAAKRANPVADTSAWERDIDERVYRLYGLTAEEMKIVEESVRG